MLQGWVAFDFGWGEVQERGGYKKGMAGCNLVGGERKEHGRRGIWIMRISLSAALTMEVSVFPSKPESFMQSLLPEL